MVKAGESYSTVESVAHVTVADANNNHRWTVRIASTVGPPDREEESMPPSLQITRHDYLLSVKMIDVEFDDVSYESIEALIALLQKTLDQNRKQRGG